MQFRKDIQGLRALAVIVVIIFHLGFLPNGYLGVDVFFVISGFLIIGIINKDFINDRYSIKDFYVRRFRRIIPLVLVTALVALTLGIYFMLPDDLENLSQSIIATNFFSNNVLQLLTVRNYWDVMNEYKPLMHTWSLGVEEQFYIVIPFLFLFSSKKNNKIFAIIMAATIASALTYIFYTDESVKFYMLPMRFFEISIGGLAALKVREIKSNVYISSTAFFVLIVFLFLDFGLPGELETIITVISTVLLIVYNKSSFKINEFLESRIAVYIGTISFSLYMWHQVILAFYRYSISQDFTLYSSLMLGVVMLIVAVLSYHFVEDYFRKPHNISTRKLVVICSFLFLGLNAASFYIYLKAGVIRDIPELEISAQRVERGMHAKYNSRIRELTDDFTASEKINVLLIGNSFARDWANVLLESAFSDQINISYSEYSFETKNLQNKLDMADVIFFSPCYKADYLPVARQFKIDEKKLWIVGTKNFGPNNGLLYNQKRNQNNCDLRANVSDYALNENQELKEEWGDRYIDLLSYVMDKNNKVPVFTQNCEFISQDTRHFTRSGAEFFAAKVNLAQYLDIAKISHSHLHAAAR
ncbi:acyltransferase family protein [Arcticibacter sp.]|uniref:acyltransferase family protein n=1 Tax=Arcticibacter sp. TaxID=1872630 RepID=UPI0038902D48